MGADKNSSRRLNSTYVPNSQPRIPTRVCQGRIVTTNLPTLGTNPKQSQSKSETQEAKDLAALRNTRRTVRKHLADCPRGLGGPSAGLRRTARNQLPNHQYCTSITDRTRRARGLSAPSRTVLHSSTDRL
jgi:hypothetical protein